MHNLKFLVVIFLLFSLNGLCQDMERVRSNLDFLSSPNFAGRGYVNEGDRKAATFIASKYQEIGLQSVLESSYFQKFNFPINTFPGEVSLSLDGKKMKLGIDFIVSSESPSISGKASVYILDTLLFTDSTALRTFSNLKAQNKILVYRQKDLFFIHKLAVKYQQKFYSFDQYIELVEKKLTASVSPTQHEKPTFQLLKEKFSVRIKKAEFNIEAKYIANYSSQNVVGYIPGNKNADSTIAITAHYDHLGTMGEIYFPGANDNASGITMLLELADYYKKNPPAYTMVFIAFAGEEAGLLGSHYFTQNPLISLEKIKFLLNLDMVGTGNEGITVVNGAVHEKEFNILASLNNKKNYLPLIKKRGEAANSDHYFFHKKGVKTFFIYALGETTAYHDINDISETLPLTKYKEIFSLLTEFLENIAISN